jgi:lysine 2,3-aminomutase
MIDYDRTLRSIDDLVASGLAPPEARGRLEDVAARYAVAITPAMTRMIDTSDPDDPIARQFVPEARELVDDPIERPDPIDDHGHSPVPGLVHRYPDRVLLKLVHTCPVYCRFCFRREMIGPGKADALGAEDLDRMIAYITGRPGIWEAIVTGGDPFVLSVRRIAELTKRLAAIPHLKVIRWHTRVPVVAPDLVTPDLVAALRAPGLSTWVAVHANHPREFSAEAESACARLADAGVTLVSQTVLLSGVNDDADVLAELMRRFVENRIKPYYLHHPDLAPGTGHLRVDIARGQDLMRELHRRVSGLCRPVYVLDVPGGAGKVPIGPTHALAEGGGWTIETTAGERVAYPPAPKRT